MTEKELLTKKFILVDMNDAQISTEDRPIIGTQALATCIGVLLYNEEKKVAIVAHVSSEPMRAIDKIFNLIIENKLYSTKFKYKIITGCYDEHYQVKELLEEYFNDFIPFGENEILHSDIQIDEQTTSKQFAFDASTGKFVTDRVFFGRDYYMINPISYNDESTRSKHR